MTHPRQLTLPFPHTDRYDPSAFLHGKANAHALAWLRTPATWPGLRLAIHGDPGTGKTHLLHLFAAEHEATILPAAAIRGLLPLPPHGAIAIDDADTAPEPEALLHLLNTASENQRPVLLAGATPPARWPRTLADLDSRLRAITAVAIGAPDDALLQALLARLIAERQLRVDEPVQAWLLARLPRSCAAMREAAARLDRASLSAGRRVTRPLAAEILADLSTEADTVCPKNEVLPKEAADPSQGDARLL